MWHGRPWQNCFLLNSWVRQACILQGTWWTSYFTGAGETWDLSNAADRIKVRDQRKSVHRPGTVHGQLADWPTEGNATRSRGQCLAGVRHGGVRNPVGLGRHFLHEHVGSAFSWRSPRMKTDRPDISAQQSCWARWTVPRRPNPPYASSVIRCEAFCSTTSPRKSSHVSTTTAKPTCWLRRVCVGRIQKKDALLATSLIQSSYTNRRNTKSEHTCSEF